MRLLLMMLSTLILVTLMAWWLTRSFVGTSSSPAIYQSTEKQLEDMQNKVDLYNSTVNKFNH